jgi:hypothetical protein
MPTGLASLVRERIEIEADLIRQRDPLLAQMLDCPVPATQTTPERLRRGSDLQPGRGLEMVLRDGWSTPEEWGVWSLGRRAALQIAFDPAITLPVKVELHLEAFVRPGLTQSAIISLNERRVATLEFEASGREQVVEVEIHSDDLSPDFSATITFGISNPTAPADVESSSDRRKLGVAIRRLRIP